MPRTHLPPVGLLILLWATSLLAQPLPHPDDVHWDPGYGGAGPDRVAVWQIAASQTHLFALGNFDIAGDSEVPANGVAVNDGQGWRAIGEGFEVCDFYSYYADARAHDDELLVVYTRDRSDVRLVLWDGSRWQHYDTAAGEDTRFTTAFDFDDELIIVGRLSSSPDDSSGVAILDRASQTWSLVESESDSAFVGYVHAVARHGDLLFIAGEDRRMDTNRLVQWNMRTGAWKTLLMARGRVTRLDVYDGMLYAAGEYNPFNDSQQASVARYDITQEQWYVMRGDTSIITGMGDVRQLQAGPAGVFVVALVTNDSDWVVGQLLRWNADRWEPLPDADNSIELAVQGEHVFHTRELYDQPGCSDGSPPFLRRWDGASWSRPDRGLRGGRYYNCIPAFTEANGSLPALAVAGGRLYAGGYFEHAGDSVVCGLVGRRIDDARWGAVRGVDDTWYSGYVTDVELWQDRIVVAGALDEWRSGARSDFATTAAFDPEQGVWQKLMTGNLISRLAAHGDLLYTGGEYATSSSPSHSARLGVLSGAGVWKPLGFNSDSAWYTFITALAPFDGGLYFSIWGLGGSEYNTHRVIHYDGTTFEVIGYMTGDVNDLVFYKGELIAAGSFQTINGNSAHGIARWDGEQWHTLAGGILPNPHPLRPWSTINALAVDGDDLYVGGSFSNGSIGARNIARWDGATWHALGSGVNDEVQSLAVADDGLYVGGWFTFAGGRPSNHVARWSFTPLRVRQAEHRTSAGMISSIHPNPVSGTTKIRFTLAQPGHATLLIHDATGREIARLCDRTLAAGEHSIEWNTSNVAAGAYIMTVRADGSGESRTVVVR